MIRRASLLGSLSFLIAFGAGGMEAQQPQPQVERLVTLANLWGTLRHFHPWLASRTGIDWDAAGLAAIARIQSAGNDKEYAAAVGEMLDALGDSTSRVLQAVPIQTAPANRPPYLRTDAGIVMVTGATADELSPSLARLRKELAGARAVVFDLRSHAPVPTQARGAVTWAFDQSGLATVISTTPVTVPGERRRIHFGFNPEWGYQSGFYTSDGRVISPAPDARDLPSVFVVNAYSVIPRVALALQAVGKAAIVADGLYNEESLVTTREVVLSDGLVAQVRVGEIVCADGTTGLHPDLVVRQTTTDGSTDPALDQAVRLASALPGRTPVGEQRTLGAAVADQTYAGTAYPSAAHRILAAFRLAAAIDHFFPYRELMAKTGQQLLREYIPVLEKAGTALEYHLAVAEMAAHIQDSHGFVASPVLAEHLGSVPPLRVRMVEGRLIVTAFGTPSASTCGDGPYAFGCPEPLASTPLASMAVGDEVVTIDGIEAAHRIQQMRKYVAASTQQALQRDASYLALAGPKDSRVALTIRDAQGRIKQTELARTVWNLPYLRMSGSRSGDVYRLVTPAIGYVDLTRLEPSMVGKAFETLRHTSAIIFDMRGYPMGGAGAVPQFLYGQPAAATALLDVPVAMLSPDPLGQFMRQSIVQSSVQQIRGNPNGYKGRTLMLIDERAQSWSEHTGLLLQALHGTQFVGGATAGANGGMTAVWAPGGIRIQFSGAGVRQADGRPLQRVGLQPHVRVEPTIGGIRTGRDEVLEAAIRYLQGAVRREG